MNNIILKTAWNAHKNQKRKGSDMPYIIHPLEVAVILIENGADEDLINAGLLHDTLEDTEIDYDYILNNFGERIANIVKGASEPDKLNLNIKMTDKEKEDSWRQRKSHTIEYLKNAPIEIKLVACADKLSNIRSMVTGFNTMGNKLWERFNACCGEQKWYYEELVKSLKGISNYPMYKELKKHVEELFNCSEVMDFIKHGEQDSKY